MRTLTTPKALFLPVLFCLLLALATSASASLSNTSDPTVQTNGRVQAIAVAGDRIYIGGFFTRVDGVERNHLAAVDAATGELTGWNPNANGAVRALAVSGDGSRVYAGGSFTGVGGTYRGRLAAIDAATGALDAAWKPGTIDSSVHAMAVSEEGLYIGGDFTTVRSQSRSRLALLDETTAALEPNWAPAANGRVRTLEISEEGSGLYVGGEFTEISGSFYRNLARLDATTGAADAGWRPNPGYAVFDLAVADTRVYAAGGGIGGNLTAFDANETLTTGDHSWNLTSNGDFQAVAVAGDKVYAGGHFETVGDQDRKNLAAADAATGALDPNWVLRAGRGDADCAAWTPSTCGADVWALTADPVLGTLYAGGDFRRISGVEQAGLARFSEREECTIGGTPGNDLLEGTPDADVICGLGGDDTLNGFGGDDRLSGGPGADALSGGPGDDALVGGSGGDTASYKEAGAGVTASLVTNSATGEGSDTLTGVDHLDGSRHPDELTGSDAYNRLSGLGGTDRLDAGAGEDKLWGGSAGDELRAGAGNDSVTGDSGADALFGEDGDDSLNSQDGTDGNDSLDGGTHASGDSCTADAAERSIAGCEL